MKIFLTLLLALLTKPAFADIDRQCDNEAMSLQIHTIRDSDANEALVLEVTDQEGRTQRWISNDVEGHDFGFYAVFEGLSSRLTTGGTLTESKLLVVLGSQGRLAEKGAVHHFRCF